MIVLRYWPLAVFGAVGAFLGGIGFFASNPETLPQLPIWDVDIEHRHHDLATPHEVTFCAADAEISSEAPPLPCETVASAISCPGCCSKEGKCCCEGDCQCPTCSCKTDDAVVAATPGSHCGPNGCTAPFSVLNGPAVVVDAVGPPSACGPDGCHAPPPCFEELGPPMVALPGDQPAHFSPEAMHVIMEARIAEAVAKERLRAQRKMNEFVMEVFSEHAEVVAENKALEVKIATMEERMEEYSGLIEVIAEKAAIEAKMEAHEAIFQAYGEMQEERTELVLEHAELKSQTAVLASQLEQAQAAAETNGQLKQQVSQLEHLLHENDILRTHIGVLEEELFQTDIIKTAESKDCPAPKPAVKR